MAAEEKKGSTAAPLYTVLALAGIAGVAYLAYRRLSEKGHGSVGDLLDMVDKASRKLEDRLSEFATAIAS